MTYKKVLLVASALVIIGAASIKPAMAYFTDYTMASGTRTVKVHDSELPPPEDNVEGMIKTVAISNTGDFDVYVRVKAICPEGFSVKLTDENSGWILNEDGYYYYSDIVKNKNAQDGKTTSNLNLEINVPEGNTDDFNIIIVQEASKVHYNADGTSYADWEKDVIVAQESVTPSTQQTTTEEPSTESEAESTTTEESTEGGEN